MYYWNGEYHKKITQKYKIVEFQKPTNKNKKSWLKENKRIKTFEIKYRPLRCIEGGRELGMRKRNNGYVKRMKGSVQLFPLLGKFRVTLTQGIYIRYIFYIACYSSRDILFP